MKIKMKKIKTQEERPIYFSTIYQYCSYMDYDFQRFMKFWKHQWGNGSKKTKLDPEKYLQVKKQSLLYLINKKWKESNSRSQNVT